MSMKSKGNILLVEDEPTLADAIVMNLEFEDYEVRHVASGTDAIFAWRQHPYDLIILDVMIPELNGFDVCRAIRGEDKKTAIMFLTARNDPKDRVEGLKAGGDDYLAKPFNLEEFLLRVHKLIARSGSPLNEQSVYKFADNTIDFDTFEATTSAGKNVKLGKREAQLLKLLIENEGQTVSRDTILNRVWGDDESPSSRTIDNFILGFRKHFEADPKNPTHFHSVRGIGYRFAKA